MFLYSLFADFEFYYERTDLVMWASMAGAALNVGLNWLLIPRLGYQVAAWTTLVGYVAYVGMHYAFMRRVQRDEMGGARVYDLRVIVGVLAAFGVAAAALMALYPHPLVRYAACLLALVLAFPQRGRIARALGTLREGRGPLG